jgi:hypothetical protein
MAKAKYTVHVPTTDELGQPLRLHEAVHEHLVNSKGTPVQTQHGTPAHAVSAWADDIPEWDSLAKQTGTLAAELANVPAVHVTKEGDKPAAWEMGNTHYVPGAGADQTALALGPQPTGVHAALVQAAGR